MWPISSTPRVVVPVDFSEHAEAALEAASHIVRSGGRLLLVHVLDRVDLATPGLVWPAQDDEARRVHALRALEARVRAGLQRDAEIRVLGGDPGRQIVRFAAEEEADLIVMSSRGRTGIARLTTGSVAERVVRLAGCPVLVLKREDQPAAATAQTAASLCAVREA